MILHIIKAEYLGNHRVHVWFNDGADGEINLASQLTGDIFAPLRDANFFAPFQLEGHTLSWPNGADFAPEYLRQLTHSSAAA